MELVSHTFLKNHPTLRECIRKLIASIYTHEPSSFQDIVMFSSRRSGSTLLAEALGAEPKLRYINEPFGPKYLPRTLLKDYPQYSDFLKKNKILEVPQSFRSALKHYVQDIKSTEICGPYNPVRMNFHWVSNRRIFKIIHCNPILDFFLEEFPNFFFFFLIRHPIPTILSLNKSYGIQLSLYLENQHFCKKYLEVDKIQYIREIIREGNKYKMWAAEWALDHIVPFLKVSQNNSHPVIPIISYESLLTAPKTSIDFLAQYLSLKNPEIILRELATPSASTSLESLKKIKSRGTNELISGWRKKLSLSDEEDIFTVINYLGVDFYEKGKDYIQDKYNVL